MLAFCPPRFRQEALEWVAQCHNSSIHQFGVQSPLFTSTDAAEMESLGPIWQANGYEKRRWEFAFNRMIYRYFCFK